MSTTLPAYTPTSWELRLPNYPVITNSWRSSSFPELLGSFPSGAEWRLRFENMTSAEAFALLIRWKATGGGQWPLDILPAEIVAGVDNTNFRRRLRGTTWAIAREPQKESVKNGRFNVTIELVHDLTFSSLYGPRTILPPPVILLVRDGVSSSAGAVPSGGISENSILVISGNGKAGATVTVYNGSTVLGTSIVQSSGAWSFVTNALSNNTYQFTSKVTDSIGNESNLSAAYTVTVDTTVAILWSSRLITAGDTGESPNMGPAGTMAIGSEGVTFQAFWFRAATDTATRVVVVKRSKFGRLRWQKWSGQFGDAFTSRDSKAPLVYAMPDGGCVLVAQHRLAWGVFFPPASRTMRVWRLDVDGNVLWGKDYSVPNGGPTQILLNGSNLIIGTESVHGDGSQNYFGPALILLDSSNGNVVDARVYKINNSNQGNFYFRSAAILSNGRIVASVQEATSSQDPPYPNYLLEISANLQTVHAAYRYAFSSNGVTRAFCALPQGGILIAQGNANGTAGLIRLDANYEVLSHTIPRFPDNFAYTNSTVIAVTVDSGGNGYMMRTPARYLTDIGSGLGILRITNNGENFNKWNEIDTGRNIGFPWVPGGDFVPLTYAQQIDFASGRGAMHIARVDSFTACRVTATGFMLSLPTTLGSLDTSTCNNTMSVQGFESSIGSTISGSTITRETTTAPQSAISCTATTATISITDCSDNLTWDRRSLQSS